MKFTDEIKIAMIRKGVSQSELAARLNTSSQNLSNKMKRDDYKMSDLSEIANVLGMELVVELKDKQ